MYRTPVVSKSLNPKWNCHCTLSAPPPDTSIVVVRHTPHCPYTCTYMSIYMYVYVHIHVCICRYVCVYVHVHMCKQASNSGGLSLSSATFEQRHKHVLITESLHHASCTIAWCCNVCGCCIL